MTFHTKNTVHYLVNFIIIIIYLQVVITLFLSLCTFLSLSPPPSPLPHSPSLPGLAKAHGVQLRAGGALLRLRLYQALVVLAPTAYEGTYALLL